jgi:cytochrome c553
VVARGRKPGVFACGFCHRADGSGGPENSSLGGLPAAYIAQQMAEFRSGARATSLPERDPPKFMIALSREVTDAEVAAAAEYFSTIMPRSNISVVETASVPKTFATGWHLAAAKSADTEPLGRRIVEIPEELERFEGARWRPTRRLSSPQDRIRQALGAASS